MRENLDEIEIVLNEKINSKINPLQAIKSKLKNKKYKCDICDMKFNSFGNLNQHESFFHAGEKLFKCEICGNHSADRKQLKDHEKTHAEQKVECITCGKWVQRSYLLKHEMIHSGDKSRP